jgi:hypothetical protein
MSKSKELYGHGSKKPFFKGTARIFMRSRRGAILSPEKIVSIPCIGLQEYSLRSVKNAITEFEKISKKCNPRK